MVLRGRKATRREKKQWRGVEMDIVSTKVGGNEILKFRNSEEAEKGKLFKMEDKKSQFSHITSLQ